MAKRNTFSKAETGKAVKTGSNGSIKRTSTAFETAKHGIGTASRTGAAISEVYSKIGCREDLHPVEQASLLLNAIGKQISLENLKLRAGVYKIARSEKVHESYFLGA